jgi:membrane fusion protein (multidrug efflux system)
MNRIVLLLGVVVYFAACTSNKESKTETGKFPVTNPLKLDTTYLKEYIADIQSIQNIEIRTKIRGYIEKIYVDEGQFVKAGQILFSINKLRHD